MIAERESEKGETWGGRWKADNPAALSVVVEQV